MVIADPCTDAFVDVLAVDREQGGEEREADLIQVKAYLSKS